MLIEMEESSGTDNSWAVRPKRGAAAKVSSYYPKSTLVDEPVAVVASRKSSRRGANAAATVASSTSRSSRTTKKAPSRTNRQRRRGRYDDSTEDETTGAEFDEDDDDDDDEEEEEEEEELEVDRSRRRNQYGFTDTETADDDEDDDEEGDNDSQTTAEDAGQKTTKKQAPIVDHFELVASTERNDVENMYETFYIFMFITSFAEVVRVKMDLKSFRIEEFERALKDSEDDDPALVHIIVAFLNNLNVFLNKKRPDTSNWNLALMRAINNMIRLREFSLEYNPMLNLEAETADDEAKSFKTLTPAMKVVILKDLVDRQLVHAQAVHEFVDERCRNRKKEVEIETLVSAFAFDKDGHSIYKIPGTARLYKETSKLEWNALCTTIEELQAYSNGLVSEGNEDEASLKEHLEAEMISKLVAEREAQIKAEELRQIAEERSQRRLQRLGLSTVPIMETGRRAARSKQVKYNFDDDDKEAERQERDEERRRRRRLEDNEYQEVDVNERFNRPRPLDARRSGRINDGMPSETVSRTATTSNEDLDVDSMEEEHGVNEGDNRTAPKLKLLLGPGSSEKSITTSSDAPLLPMQVLKQPLTTKLASTNAIVGMPVKEAADTFRKNAPPAENQKPHPPPPSSSQSGYNSTSSTAYGSGQFLQQFPAIQQNLPITSQPPPIDQFRPQSQLYQQQQHRPILHQPQLMIQQHQQQQQQMHHHQQQSIPQHQPHHQFNPQLYQQQQQQYQQQMQFQTHQQQQQNRRLSPPSIYPPLPSSMAYNPVAEQQQQQHQRRLSNEYAMQQQQQRRLSNDFMIPQQQPHFMPPERRLSNNLMYPPPLQQQQQQQHPPPHHQVSPVLQQQNTPSFQYFPPSTSVPPQSFPPQYEKLN